MVRYPPWELLRCCYGISCLPLSHLLRRVSSLRYSRYHLLQKYCLIWWMHCQLDNRPNGTVLKSRSRKLVSVSPIRKWPGVRTGGSFGSDDMGVSVRELRMASISTTRVWRCSKVNSSVPTTRMRWRLKDFTAASHKPPKCGEFGGLKRHCICRSAKKFCTLSLWSSDCNRVRSSCSSRLAPTKLVPLSARMVAQCPRREMNRRRAARKASVVRSLTSSMWTAFVAKQTNMAAYILILRRLRSLLSLM